MTSLAQSQCVFCHAELSSGSRGTRKYCNDSCRNAAWRSSNRHSNDEDNLRLTRHITELRRRIHRMDARLEAARDQRGKDRATIRRAVLRAERAERQMREQAERLAHARNQSARYAAQRDEARRQLEGAPASGAEFDAVRRNLEKGRTAYRRLNDEYTSVVASLERVSVERRNLQSVVKDWDRLCRR